MRHSILAVCHGNICRSPVVERVLGQRLDASAVVTSAGTHAVVGRPIDMTMAKLLRDQGFPTEGFHARQLTAPMIDGASLIITMTVDQRTEVVSTSASAARRTFTLLELAQLMRIAPPVPPTLPTAGARWSALPDLVGGLRHQLQAPPGSLDIADPYQRTAPHYLRAFEQITKALDELVRLTRPRRFDWDPSRMPLLPVSAPGQARESTRGNGTPRHVRPR